MLKPNVLAALNAQIGKELHSSHLYLSMAAYFESVNYSGFAHYMKVQALEERAHAMKIFEYVVQRSGTVELGGIEAPHNDWTSVVDALEKAYNHELFISNSIHELVHLARQEKDLPTENFLAWFVSEQVEEEATALDVYENAKRVNENGLFYLDRQLKKRI